MKLMSCVTAEYALGFQRPYLTTADRKVVDVYNTYVAAALPKGPICVVDDGSLAAAIAVRQSRPIVYFFYDYILDGMFFFEDYTVFHAAALEARARYVANSDIPMDVKVNKQELFGKGPVTRLTYPK
jgi:cell division protein YceG involved in septum cleavage